MVLFLSNSVQNICLTILGFNCCSCTVPEKKKLEDENSIDSSLDASQRLKLVSLNHQVLWIYDFSKLI